MCPQLRDISGLYILTREENGIKYGYVGQSKHLVSRLADHLSGYQHIDLSIKAHRFYSADNPTGYKIQYLYCSEDKLDEYEQLYIRKYASMGYQLRNKTGGSQGKGKFGISDNRPAKGYYDGKKQGRTDLINELKPILDRYLVVSLKVENKLSQRMLDKFWKLLSTDDKKNN